MGYVTISRLILISACLLATIVCDSLTTRPITAPYRKGRSPRHRCYRTALCDTCLQTEIRCEEDSDLSLLNARNFKDDFCGHHGVVLVEKESSTFHGLIPLECSYGICPEKSECRHNPNDGMPYCCSLEKLEQSRCFTLDLVKSNKEAAKHKITDHNGNPVNISTVTIVLEKSDVKCLQGWSFSYKDDTLYMSNQCPVRLEICYEPGPSTTISPNTRITDVEISCQEVPFACGKKQHKTMEIVDSKNNSVNILNMTVVQQLTKVVCKEGKNFFFNGSSISIKDGCGAIFQVCYPELVTEIIAPSPRRAEEGNKAEENQIIIFVPAPKVKTNPPVETTPEVEINPPVETTPEVETNPPVVTTPEVETTPPVVTTQEVETNPPVETTTEVETNPPVVTTPEVETNPPVVTTPEVETTPPVETTTEVETNPPVETTTEVETNPPVVTTPKVQINAPVCQSLTLRAPEHDSAINTLISTSNNPLLLVSMELVEQLSTVQCIQWVNYYFEGSTVLAKSGCWGQFEVCYLENVSLTPLVLQEPPGQSCRFITLSSIRSREVQRDITDVQGQTVTLRSMTLVRQFSQAPCVKGTTFSFGGSTAVARGGCIGTFQICSDAKDNNFTAPEGEICDRELAMFSHILEPDVYNLKGNPLAIRGMILVKQISEIRCVAGHSFFFYGPVLHAIDGCSGIFNICYNVSGGLTEKPTVAATTSVPTRDDQKCQRVKLTSRLMHPVERTFYDAQGHLAPITSVTIVEQISKIKCVKGDTFKVSQYRLRASGGCQAVFDVCLDSADEEITTPASTTVPRREDKKCQHVKLMSGLKHPVHKAFYDAQGHPTPIARVTIVEQISKIECVKGDTFKVSQHILRASDGCQAVFDVCLYSADEEITTPASTTEDNQKCEQVKLSSRLTLPVKKTFLDAGGYPIHIKSVAVMKPLSQIECVEGDTFVVYPYALRVFGGCKAIFKICLGRGVEELSTPAPPTDEACMKLNIDSSGPRKLKAVQIVDRNKRPARVTSVEVDQQITDVPCEVGETFRFEDNIVRATNGCGAVFNVCYETEALSNPEEECVNVTLRSRLHMTRSADVRDKNNNPVHIVNVKVLTQLSNSPCVHRETYDYGGGTLRASDGCSAIFKVCYEKESRIKD